jgi:regulator of protease activity HflC (stomatin/prohibitin superfamily)
MFWLVITAFAGLIFTGAVVVWISERNSPSEYPEGSMQRTLGNRPPNFAAYALGAAVTTLIIWLAITGLKTMHAVENGHIGIVKQFGSLVGTTGEGLVTTAPWQSLDEVSVQNELKTYDMLGDNAAVSSDSQAVFLIAQVNYSLQREEAVPLYRETGGHFVERILDPAVFQNTKETTAAYKAIDFARNREKIRRQIQEAISSEVGRHGILINNVSLKNVDFTKALSAAIEQTVEAEQQAARERAKIEITEAEADQAFEQADGEARANIKRAQGEATANRLRQRSLTPLLVQQQAIEKLNPKVQIIVCPPRTVCVPNTTVLGSD